MEQQHAATIGIYDIDEERAILASYSCSNDTLYVSNPETGKRIFAVNRSSQVYQVKENDLIYIGRPTTKWKGEELSLSFTYEFQGKEHTFLEDKTFKHPNGQYIAFQISLAKHLIKAGVLSYG